MNVNTVKCPVFLVFSNWSLEDIKEHLQDPSYIRVVRLRDGTETNRCVCLLPEEIYSDFTSSNENERPRGLDLRRYELRDHEFPPEGCTQNLFIPLPKVAGYTAAKYRARLTEKLEPMFDCGLFDQKQCNIIIPTISRETGEVKGSCFLVFDKKVPVESVALARCGVG